MLTCINWNYCPLDGILCAGVGVTLVSASQLCCRARTLSSGNVLVGARRERRDRSSRFPGGRTRSLMDQFKERIPGMKTNLSVGRCGVEGVSRTPIRDEVITS